MCPNVAWRQSSNEELQKYSCLIKTNSLKTKTTNLQLAYFMLNKNVKPTQLMYLVFKNDRCI